MGMNAPEQKASGSGITTQRSFLPDDIVNSSQNAFRSTMGNTLAGSQALNNAPAYGQIGQYNPANLNLQSKDTSYDFGQMFSENFDPIVQAQMSQGISDQVGIANNQNARISQQLGGNPANAALVATLQADNNRGAAMSAGPARLAAMQQQRDYDVQRQGMLQNQYGLDQQRMAQANQAALAGRDANERAFQLNANAIQTNNQSALNQYNAQLQNQQMQQAFMQSLGQGLISTAPQIQGNFTTDDLSKLNKNPGLLNPLIYGGGGILSQDQLAQMGGANYQMPQISAPPTLNTNPGAYDSYYNRRYGIMPN